VTRAALCGPFEEAGAVLGLDPVEEMPEIVLVDLADPLAVDRASRFDRAIPRVAVGTADHEQLLRALGVTVLLATSTHPAIIGPLVEAARPPAGRRATRTILVTGVRGGAGRTLLVAGLATRLATRSSVLVLDLTGTAAAGWWLGLSGGSWSDLEGLKDELTSEHLAVVAAEEGQLRLVGGAPAMPSPALALSATRAAGALADVVLVDSPPLNDERTVAARELADRTLVVVTDDPVSAAQLSTLPDEERTWIIASRATATRIAGRPAMRSLPEDPRAIRGAVESRSGIGGALGRAYDDLAELIAIDIT
jgi:hypothetical protein